MESLHISIPGFNYRDLHDPAKLAELSNLFADDVRLAHPSLAARFERYRAGAGLSAPEVSSLLIEMSAHLSAFVSRLFGIEKEAGIYRQDIERTRIIFQCKKEFFVRRALKKHGPADAARYPVAELGEAVQAIVTAVSGTRPDDAEAAIAATIVRLAGLEIELKGKSTGPALAALRDMRTAMKPQPRLAPLTPASDDAGALQTMLGALLDICERWMSGSHAQRTFQAQHWSLFKIPEKMSYDRLVAYETDVRDGIGHIIGDPAHYRRREGFDLTDERFERRGALSEVDYCILCHEREKDSCSRGFPEDGNFKKNPLGYSLQGCPLDQKISESHTVEGRGDCIGALAIIMIDNPMCPGTGHRICNDCMKACIYQKQDPVNIPQIETRVLTDVLNLPWGFEIYSLLTRWNPLNIERPHALPYNGKNVLVVGMGPAGYTMAHYLLNEGCAVVGIDGLKIEPLPVELTGDGATPCAPVRDYASLCRKLSERPLLGFGGVSEYGITVRWDKNFLTVLYLNLLRRSHFRVYDGVRFGGTLTVEDAWDLGFDHICFATGAGKPTFVEMEHNLLRGIRKASDILMALQLTGAGKRTPWQISRFNSPRWSSGAV